MVQDTDIVSTHSNIFMILHAQLKLWEPIFHYYLLKYIKTLNELFLYNRHFNHIIIGCILVVIHQ